jgi:hypothetical protein
MKFGKEALERAAWQRNEVGIWYGAWTARDGNEAMLLQRPAEYLTNLPHQQNAGFPDPIVTGAMFATIRRFWDMKDSDWVWVFFDDAIHCAHPFGTVQLTEDHTFDRKKERFKARKIQDKKSFRLSLLPDCFQLLPAAGQANVHEVHGTRRLLEVLVASKDEEEVKQEIQGMSFEQRLNASGPKAWEALCEAYVIMREGFVPTGLLVGRTLPVFDIIGRDRRTGSRILAQCKKSPDPEPISSSFIAALANYPESRAYYFAFGGVKGSHDGVEVVTGEQIRDWLSNDPEGRRYAEWL